MQDASCPPPAFNEPDAGVLSALFRTIPLGILVGTVSEQDDATTAANPFLRLMFGYAEELPASAVRPFAAERFADPALRRGLIERLARDGSVRDHLLRLRRVDGTLIWVEVTGSAAVGAGPFLSLTVTLRDVTERKRLDDQTRDLHQQLLQAEKLAALGQTIWGSLTS